jgi:hypothetical protein
MTNWTARDLDLDCSGQDLESLYAEIIVERQCACDPQPAHQLKGGAVGEAVALIGSPAEQGPSGLLVFRCHTYQIYRFDVLQHGTHLLCGFMAKPVKAERDRLVKDKVGRGDPPPETAEKVAYDSMIRVLPVGAGKPGACVDEQPLHQSSPSSP